VQLGFSFVPSDCANISLCHWITVSLSWEVPSFWEKQSSTRPTVPLTVPLCPLWRGEGNERVAASIL